MSLGKRERTTTGRRILPENKSEEEGRSVLMADEGEGGWWWAAPVPGATTIRSRCKVREDVNGLAAVGGNKGETL